MDRLDGDADEPGVQPHKVEQEPDKSSNSPPPNKRQRTSDSDEDDMSMIQNFIQPPKHQNVLISFYAGKTRDSEGRWLSDILNWTDETLEYEHSFIQWLFPLPEFSMVNPDAPLINRDVFAAFHTTPELMARLKKSFIRILGFYGFQLTDAVDEKGLPVVGSLILLLPFFRIICLTSSKIVKSPAFRHKSKTWLMMSNHNHLRITRIIRCLRILGLDSEAIAFYNTLSTITTGKKQIVSCRSTDYWRRAAERPLNWEPSLSEDVCQADRKRTLGPDFLREYEKLKKSRDLQKKHDLQKTQKDEREAAWLLTKEQIAAEENKCQHERHDSNSKGKEAASRRSAEAVGQSEPQRSEGNHKPLTVGEASTTNGRGELTSASDEAMQEHVLPRGPDGSE
ncbi:opioid growth factor receptor region protein [Rutstroemia sp. NJR-2017a BVV2]|nr:opioid growth factor receptor region protein [Rutstroemia sp. NJR-2017a BVV2]